jgi:hypothetical protein
MTVSRGLNFFSPDVDLFGPVEQLTRTKYLPEQLLDRYITEAMKATDVKRLEDGAMFAEIRGFDGVWACNPDLAACIAEFRETLFDWIVIKIEQSDRDLPQIAGINLNVI